MNKKITLSEKDIKKRVDTLNAYADTIINMLLNKQLDARMFQKALNGVFDAKISLPVVRNALGSMRQNTELKHLVYIHTTGQYR